MLTTQLIRIQKSQIRPMPKNDTQILKGLAILMMLFLHLFNQHGEISNYHALIYCGEEPLVYILTRMANPVPIFVILSGYGLYAVYLKGDQHRWSRLRKLFFHYWIILLVFVTIGHFIQPMKYPGSITSIIENITAYNTTYNGEHWFLFPYTMLAITSPLIFIICDKYKTIYVLSLSFIIYLGSCYLISRYGNSYLFTHMLAYHPILYSSLLFNFILGSLACKNNWLKKSVSPYITRYAWIVLIGLCILRCCMTTGAIHNLFLFSLMWLFLQAKHSGWIDKTLAHLGKHSMNMWLIHTFFCYYLFHDWIYGFKYPLLIFLVLVAMSYMSSHIINLIYAFLSPEKLFRVYREKTRK